MANLSVNDCFFRLRLEPNSTTFFILVILCSCMAACCFWCFCRCDFCCWKKPKKTPPGTCMAAPAHCDIGVRQCSCEGAVVKPSSLIGGGRSRIIPNYNGGRGVGNRRRKPECGGDTSIKSCRHLRVCSLAVRANSHRAGGCRVLPLTYCPQNFNATRTAAVVTSRDRCRTGPCGPTGWKVRDRNGPGRSLP